MAHLTFAWPVMRRAVLRIGESLAAREVMPEPGRATGAVRVIRGPRELDALQPGEILVAIRD